MAPVDPHSHDDHGHFGSRSDVASVPSWTSKAVLRGHSLMSRTTVNGKYLRVPHTIEELIVARKLVTVERALAAETAPNVPIIKYENAR